MYACDNAVMWIYRSGLFGCDDEVVNSICKYIFSWETMCLNQHMQYIVHPSFKETQLGVIHVNPFDLWQINN